MKVHLIPETEEDELLLVRTKSLDMIQVCKYEFNLINIMVNLRGRFQIEMIIDDIIKEEASSNGI